MAAGANAANTQRVGRARSIQSRACWAARGAFLLILPANALFHFDVIVLTVRHGVWWLGKHGADGSRTDLDLKVVKGRKRRVSGENEGKCYLQFSGREILMPECVFILLVHAALSSWLASSIGPFSRPPTAVRRLFESPRHKLAMFAVFSQGLFFFYAKDY